MMNDMKIKSGFQASSWYDPKDPTVYYTKNVYKAGMLRSLGARQIAVDDKDPERIVFVLQHPDIRDLVSRLHSDDCLDIKKCAEFIQEGMGIIRDTKNNLRMKEKTK